MEQKFCQSCAMPLGEDKSMYGTNSDSTHNGDYCAYCFKDGDFTADISMEEMIEFCVPHMVSANEGMNEDAARNMMKEFFPKLKRWS